MGIFKEIFVLFTIGMPT